jgi:outer membrane protein TolC
MSTLFQYLVVALVAADSAPMTLDHAVGLALIRHPSAQMAQTDQLMAEQKVLAAQLAVWPSLDLQSGALYTTSKDGQTILVANNVPMETRALVVGHVPLDTGQLSAAKLQAELEAKSMGFATQVARAGLGLSVAQAFYDELRAEHAVAAIAYAREGAEAQRKATAAQLNAGKVARLELRRAEAALANYEANLAGARADLASARRRFRTLTGVSTDFRLQEPPPPPPPGKYLTSVDLSPRMATLNGKEPVSAQHKTSLSGDAAVTESADAVARRPEVLQAETDFAARKAELRVTDFSRRPTLSVTSMAGWDTGGAPTPNNLGASYGLDLSWPLWDAGRHANAARLVELGVERAGYAIQAARLSARTDFEDAMAALEKAQVQYYAQSRSRAVADEALSMARIGFKEGAVPGLELLNAQQAAVAARVAQQNAIYDYHQAAAKLRWAAGLATP